MSDAQDAARWRAIKALLRLDVEEREWWETTAESGKGRKQEKRYEWAWCIEFGPEAFKLYVTTDNPAVPKDIDEAMDRIIARERDAASNTPTSTKGD